ncbi:hypothetical protein [Acetobacter sp.]|uniref:hypothetical protein n=1 Tax=Acetobacter sp. TaxID=440 RepID=UPI0039E74C80
MTDDLPPLEMSIARNLAGKVRTIIDEAVKITPGLPASEEAQKLVARRMPPEWLPKYEVMDNYGFVVWDEIMTILDRVLAYPYVTLYRKHLVHAPKDVIRAWQFHSHSLRVGELYIVLDRTVELLKFLAVVGKDVGLSITNQQKSFEKAFKKTFKRHLQERHRLTHAHERQSLTSRTVDFAGGKWTDNESESATALTAHAAMLFELFREVSKKAGYETMNTLEDIVTHHELTAQREARQMLDQIGKALFETLNIGIDGP